MYIVVTLDKNLKTPTSVSILRAYSTYVYHNPNRSAIKYKGTLGY